MGALQLKGMAIMRNLETAEEFDTVRDFLLTDPLKITHMINFWKQELPNTLNEDKAKVEKMIAGLKQLLMNQANLTMNVYSFGDKDATEIIKKDDMVIEDAITTAPEMTVKPADVKLTVVKADDIPADENRILRVKYESIIKKINVDALKQMIKDLIKASKQDEAQEVATFILSNGLYTGKKVKQWSKENIEKFFQSCLVNVDDTTTTRVETPIASVAVESARPIATAAEAVDKGIATVVEVPVEEPLDQPAADEDLYVKYKAFLGDNAIAHSGLRTEIKFQLNEGNVDMALELGTFLLAEGLCSDDPKKWSNFEIEAFFKDIKQELLDKPMDLNPENVPPVDVTTINTEQPVVEEVDIKMVDMYSHIKNQIINEDATEETIKRYVFNLVATQKVENLTMYNGKENTQEELEAMYATFFISFVANAYKVKNLQQMDVKVEIANLIQKCIDNKDKGLGKAIQSAGLLYRQRGENITIKEVKEIVYEVCKEKYPEYYADLMKTFQKPEDVKLTIVPADTEATGFDKKYPEVWESIKDTNPSTLDDVYTMARELEKSQSFLVVSEMITHFISSGKINHSTKTPHPVKWDSGQIELWINNMFKNAETVAEATVEPVVNVDPTTPAPVLPTEPLETVSQAESTVAPETVEVAPTESAPVVHEPTANGIKAPGCDYVIPADKVPFARLYADNSVEFWAGFQANILRLEQEGMSRKDIIHTMADVIKEIAKNDDLRHLHARNFKKTNINAMYDQITRSAIKYEIPGWGEKK